MSLADRLGSLGLLVIAAVAAAALFASPDGQERAEAARFFGNLHPLAVHLPIALLLLVPLLEVVGRRPSLRYLREAAAFVLALAALSAIGAVCLGWLHAWSGGFEGGFVVQHMWGGIVVAASATLAWMVRARSAAQSATLPRSYVGLLVFAVLVMSWTGYRGGQLAHGEPHLVEHLPQAVKSVLGVNTTPAQPDANTFYAARIAPIFDKHCVVCHGARKHKGGLRLDSHAALLKGGDDGAVIVPGKASDSELFRRVTLNREHEDFMPAEGKPPLSDENRKLLQVWIDAGASATVDVEAVAGAAPVVEQSAPAAPDYTAERATIARLETDLGIRLVPRSLNPTDGLVLRTASSPGRCDDRTLAALAPVARYIVDAELARTKVTDAGLPALAQFVNIRSLDLSQTAVTSAGLREIAALAQLEVVNLTATAVDDAGIALLRENKAIKRLHVFATRADPPG
jgi:uncharacterized membrane protein/mono/diheme cytochrome c family protein